MRTPQFLSLASLPPLIQTHIFDCSYLTSSFECLKGISGLICVINNLISPLTIFPPIFHHLSRQTARHYSQFFSSSTPNIEITRKSYWLYIQNIFSVWELLTLSTHTTLLQTTVAFAWTNAKNSYLFSLPPRSSPDVA